MLGQGSQIPRHHLRYEANLQPTKAVGKTLILKLSMVHWLHTTVVRPMITYDMLIWWPKIQQQ